MARKSYGKDILFVVDRIIKIKNGNDYAILKGVMVRIEATAPIDDIEKVNKKRILKAEKSIEEIIENCMDSKIEKRIYYSIDTGKILHLDGDTHYR